MQLMDGWGGLIYCNNSNGSLLTDVYLPWAKG